MKYLKLILKILGIIVGTVLLLLVIDYAVLNGAYLINKSKYVDTFSVQGVKNKYTPQGLTYSEKYNVALQTSYNSDHTSVSMLYVTDLKTNKLLKSLKLKEVDGSNNTNHVGGITTDNETVWISNNYEVNEFSLEEILNTDKDYIQSKKNTKLIIRGDFCTYDKDILWIGDFFLKGIYDCPDDNPLLFGYKMDKELDYDDPDYIISLPMMVQGMVITEDGKFVFTHSYTNLIRSRLTVYDNVLEEKPSTYKMNGKEYPYYSLDKHNRLNTYLIPPMAEELFLKDNKLYILFESSSDTYFYALPKADYIVNFDIKEMGN